MISFCSQLQPFIHSVRKAPIPRDNTHRANGMDLLWFERLSNSILMTIGRVCISQLIRHRILMTIMIENKNIKFSSPQYILLCRVFMACPNEIWYSQFHPSHTHARIHKRSNERDIQNLSNMNIFNWKISLFFYCHI